MEPLNLGISFMKKFLLALLVIAIAGIGIWRWSTKPGEGPGVGAAGEVAPAADGGSGGGGAPAAGAAGDTGAEALAGLVETETAVPRLAPVGTFVPVDNTVLVEISEYAGYAGLLAANAGRLEPNEESFFFREYGFKVQIAVSEEESWGPLNSGKIAAATTTVDVLAVYGNQLRVVVPVQLGFSRGADAILVKSEIRRMNDLKGKTLVASQFTEVDFFIRYLAQEGGIPVQAVTPGKPARGDAINLVYAEDAFTAGDLFLEDLQRGGGKFAGAVAWEPKVSEVVRNSGGQAKILVSNRNLLVVADILLVNRGFAEANAKTVEGLAAGALWGNDQVRTRPEEHLDMLQRVFGWSPEQGREELGKIHFSNYPENRAFFSGAIDAAGSFGGIYQAAVFAYGDLVSSNISWERFLGPYLEPLEERFTGQVAAIVPIKTRSGEMLEVDPLLSRDIRFYFEPNSDVLSDSAENDVFYQDIQKMLQVSPGSRVLLRGHVDNARIPELRAQGGEALVRSMGLGAMELSRKRANAVRNRLVERFEVEPARLEVVGRGWEEPVGKGEENRRVEVYWYTLE